MAKNDNLKDFLEDLYYNGIVIKNPKASKNPQDFTQGILDIQAGEGVPEIQTEEEMNRLLVTGELNGVYKYVGESGTYEKDTLYIRVEPTLETSDGHYVVDSEGSIISLKVAEFIKLILKTDLEDITITENGEYSPIKEGYSKVTVEVEPTLEEITITENGEYLPSGDGYSKVTVTVPIPDGYIIPEGTIGINNTDEVDVTNYATAKVVDSNLIAENIAKDITILGITGTFESSEDSPLPIEVSTEEEMTALLASGEVGSVYKYVGTTGTYENEALYELTEEESDPFQGTWVWNDTPTLLPFSLKVELNFSSNSTDYARLINTNSGINYHTSTSGIGTYVYRDDAWNDNNFKTFTINSTYESIITYRSPSFDSPVSNSIFLDYLQANATKQPSRTFAKLILQSDLEEITITENGEYEGEYSRVSVNVPIPEGYLKPEGTITIEENGTIDVTSYESANVNVNIFSTYIATKQYPSDFSKLFSDSSINDTQLNTLMNGLDTSSVTNVSNMFYQCENLTTIPLFDTSNVTNMSTMFRRCTNLTTIPQLDTNNVTTMSFMFDGCSNLTIIPQLDTGNVTDMEIMFRSCTNLTTIPQLDTSNVTTMYSMFEDCTNLTTIPQLNTSNVTTMYSMFYGCSNLTTIPQLDTSNVTDMMYMFRYCTNLTTIPQLDTSNVTDMSGMFDGCTNLTTILQLNASNVTSATNMFRNCTNLKTILMYDMKVDFDISASTMFETDDLVTILNNLPRVGTIKTLTMGETNLAKLSDEQKLIASQKRWKLA